MNERSWIEPMLSGQLYAAAILSICIEHPSPRVTAAALIGGEETWRHRFKSNIENYKDR